MEQEHNGLPTESTEQEKAEPTTAELVEVLKGVS